MPALFFAFMLLTALAQCITLHVDQQSSNCNDARGVNATSRDEPLCTVQAAASLVQPGYSIYVWPGVYRESVVPAKGGTSTKKVSFIAQNGEGDVVLTGASVVEGWKQCTTTACPFANSLVAINSIYYTFVDWYPLALYQNNEKLTLCASLLFDSLIIKCH